jgi:hypothetical protein
MIKNETNNIKTQLEELQKRLEISENKYGYLEVCHSELANRNNKINSQLLNVIDKEKQLENLILLVINNFAPNFFVKNTEYKIVENNTNLLPEINNQIIELNKSNFNRNEILNKIINKKKHFTENEEVISSSHNIPSLPFEIKCDRKFSESEKSYFKLVNSNKILKNASSDENNNLTKLYPRRSNSIQIIEDNYNNDIMENRDLKSDLLYKKRNRDPYLVNNSDLYDQMCASSNYKIEKNDY